MYKRYYILKTNECIRSSIQKDGNDVGSPKLIQSTKSDFFLGNNKSILGVFQSGRGGLPRGRGRIIRQGAYLPGKITQFKKFVKEEIADTTKKVLMKKR